jgi:RimJ/RimL family protein N-acetyltransferase
VAALQDEAIKLRAFIEDDIPAIAAACRDPEIQRWTRVPSPYTEDDARAFVTATNEHALAIADRASGELLGAVGARIHDERVIDVGYWVKREARGRGLAARALKLISRWAFQELGAARVQLVTEPENRPSQRVAEKAGFRARACFAR